MFHFMRDTEPQDPAMYLMDPFALHRQHMRHMFSGDYGMSPFLSLTDGSVRGLPRPAPSRTIQPQGAVTPYGMMGMGGGFMDMFGMMNDLVGNMEQMTSGSNCQTYSSSTVISYSNMAGGTTPKVYHEVTQTRVAPGGIRETRRAARDSDSGMEQMSIGHHIRDRSHIVQRSHNRRTGDQEESQEFINMDENDAAGFDEEWTRQTSRYRGQRGVACRRQGGAEDRLAIQGPEDNSARPSRRYDW